MKQWLNDPQNLAKLHFWAAVAWMVIGVPAAWYITYVMVEPHAAFAILVVSLYANSATHLSAYGAARAEQIQTAGSDEAQGHQ